MGISFILLAEGAAFDVAVDKRGEAGPPEFSGDQLMCFQEAGVSGRLVIMAPFQDGTSEGIIGGNIDTAFVGEDAGFDLPVGEARTEWERDVFMHGLESLEDEGVSCRGGFYAVGEGGVD